MLEKDSLKLLRDALNKLEAGFASLPANDVRLPGAERMADVLAATAERLHDNYPYFHPMYAGQMLKPPHPVARLAYALAQWINPNNHALDGGRASSQMEKEAVAQLAKMFGWDVHLGHLCGGGTMANLEALWVAGQLAPGKTILASEQAHYTHQRISGVLNLPFETVACDAQGRMDLAALQTRLERGNIGTVVATLGTTATGSVDPLAEDPRAARKIQVSNSRRRCLWRIFCPRKQSSQRGRPCLRPHRTRRLYRHRSPQAWITALRMWLRIVPRSGRWQALQARVALHLLQLKRTPFGRDQLGVLTPRSRSRRPLGNATTLATREARRIRTRSRSLPSGSFGFVPATEERPALCDCVST